MPHRAAVEIAEKQIDGASWSVSGIDRSGARVVSPIDGGPAYGGTPSDASVVADRRSERARAQVTLYPFVMMDIPAGNALTDP